MITFKITLLLAFDANGEAKSGKPKKKKRDSSRGSKKKGSVKNKKKTPKNVPVEIKPQKPKYVVDVGEAIGWVHIEYELIPKRFKYKIDVVCLGPVAKVFYIHKKRFIRWAVCHLHD